MASADYSVGTKVTADVSNFEKGMNKAEKSLKGFSNKLADNINRLGKKGLVGSIANVTLAMGGLTQSFNTVIKFAKNVSKAINECTEAYKGQVIAERALDTAIQNNPFISGASSKALKEFASEMQKVSNYGDEELIPMMTNLVSLGRTESETMQIMAVAMDMSAGMGISLDTAITQLNATLNGNIGRLGQQNAELKGLTEEELKQGKAIEILGEKFKGLSSATADTSKQLQNIKGDFKEALGQFTLPSSDMWNKFWAGFYERGIEVINKLNAFIDAQTIGRKIAKEVKEQMNLIPESNIKGRTEYARKVIQALSDEELKALGKYLEGSSGYLDIILDHSRKTREEVIAQEEAVNNIANTLQNKLGDSQFRILRNVAEEMEVRRINTREAKAQAEAKAEQAKAEELATIQLKEQEKIEAKKTDWASKLLDQRIEMLETERDRAMQFAEEEGAETYSIWRDYNEKILELKLERLEKEKEKALAEEGLTAEDKIKVEEYYSGETKKIYSELGDYKKKKGKEEEKDEKNKFAIILAYVKKYAQNVKQIFSKIASYVKNVFSAIKNVFNKALDIFNFNPDEALTSLLKIEDAVLTFFVETLPKLPAFFASAIQSIMVLLENLISYIDWNSIQKMFNSIIDVITKNAPAILSNLMKVVINIAQVLLNGIIHFMRSGGWKMLLDFLLELQQALEAFVVDNIDDLAETIAKMLPDLVDMLIKSIVSASRTLGKIAKTILPLIADIIIAIVDVITSNEVIKSSIEAVEGLVEGLIPAIVKIIVKAIPKIINLILLKLPSYTPQLLTGILKGIINGITRLDFSDLVKSFFEGFDDALGSFDIGSLADSLTSLFKRTMSYEFWVDTLSNFATAIGTLLSETVKRIFSNPVSLISGNSFINTAKKIIDPFGLVFHANGTNNASAGLSIVGEAGPELVRFRGGEQVLNNRNTNKALAEMGGNTNNFNVTFNNLKDTSAFTMMQQLKAYNRQMAINSII